MAKKKKCINFKGKAMFLYLILFWSGFFIGTCNGQKDNVYCYERQDTEQGVVWKRIN